mmetsp:Transcript_4495/g.8183  ORF Transcript_4495/g.8183 Transcript_4495/m.8183 type:complete len:342 (+) Transcript_4495:115-1140(+)
MVLAEILLLLLAFPSVSLASEAEAEALEGDTASADATCGYLYERIVSIADLHGDLEKAKKVLKLTGVVGENGQWIGGNKTLLIQTGDMVDRGPNSLEVVEYFQKLQKSADSAGGKVVNLLGNHEIMLLDGRSYYLNPEEAKRHGGREQFLSVFEEKVGEFLRKLPVVHLADRTLYTHAGLEPKFGNLDLESINIIATKGLQKGNSGHHRSSAASSILQSQHGPVWTRGYDIDYPQDAEAACSLLAKTLTAFNADRMVIGHNVQRNAQPGVHCDGKLFLMDVGMSRVYGDASPVVLEVRSRTAASSTGGGSEGSSSSSKSGERAGCQQEVRLIKEDVCETIA